MADVANYSKSMAPFCREAVIRNCAVIRIFQALIVHDKAFLQVFFERGVCPAAELSATGRFHAKTYCKDDIKTV